MDERGENREGRDDRRPEAAYGKLKGDPNGRPRDKYADFIKTTAMTPPIATTLKRQIEALIRRGRLREVCQQREADPPQNQAPRRDNDRPGQPIGDIRMIVGGTTRAGSSKKARKTYIGAVRTSNRQVLRTGRPRIGNPPIEFSEVDARRLHHPHDDALVVTIRAGDYNIHRVLVDNGSSADILYYPAFQRMRIERERLTPVNAPLIGFGGARVHPARPLSL
ncbi:uncharacterized protein LOC142611933 [Castanea sativa]|uniref:uncharacterized protein LOC142611933 n=1 Tax=Castanea sativa TaxID=21020 RepID=UPI003F65370C